MVAFYFKVILNNFNVLDLMYSDRAIYKLTESSVWKINKTAQTQFQNLHQMYAEPNMYLSFHILLVQIQSYHIFYQELLPSLNTAMHL